MGWWYASFFLSIVYYSTYHNYFILFLDLLSALNNNCLLSQAILLAIFVGLGSIEQKSAPLQIAVGNIFAHLVKIWAFLLLILFLICFLV